ncbi:hypothetical protein J28TS4_62000 [Paenibacillus lautus]|nr:hypothetical protein J28TS4_62000 [Paenibacillus lautus]
MEPESFTLPKQPIRLPALMFGPPLRRTLMVRQMNTTTDKAMDMNMDMNTAMAANEK